MITRQLSRVVGALVLFAPAALQAQATTKTPAKSPAKPAPAAAAATTPEALPTPQVIIDRYVKAIGGRDAILKHTSMKSTGTFEMPAAGIKADVESYTMRPNLMYVKINIPGMGEVMQGFDGTTAWSMDPNSGPRVLSGKELAQTVQRADFNSELHDTSSYSAMHTVEKTEFEGRPAYRVHLVRKGGDESYEYFDTETGLMLGSTQSMDTQMGTVTSTIVRRDYKDVGGLLAPMTMVQRMGGAEVVIRTTNVEWDTVQKDVFALPAQIKALVPAK